MMLSYPTLASCALVSVRGTDVLMPIVWRGMQMSTATGYMNMTWPGTPQGPVASIYEKMRQRNLCMHRGTRGASLPAVMRQDQLTRVQPPCACTCADFQNIGVNGARTGAFADEIMYTLNRNQTNDHPLILNYALVGNGTSLSLSACFSSCHFESVGLTSQSLWQTCVTATTAPPP
jgi:hypothetical protein